MKIKKIKGTYNDYSCELSFGQLTAVRNALGTDHADPLADELYAELNWYLDNIPGPGEEEEDIKREQEAAESGMASPEAAGQPMKPSADDLLPAPGEEEGGAAPGGPEGEMPPGPEGEGGPPPGAEEGPGEEGPPPEEEGGSEADRRLPPPPRE